MPNSSEVYKTDGVEVVKYAPHENRNNSPIVMVHGGDHGAWCWEKWATFFSEAGYEVHALNWYSHGGSDKLPEAELAKRSIADVATKEIASIVKKLGRDPILVGHSMGGLASAVYAAAHPVERLVLVAPVMPASVHPDPIPLPVDESTLFPVFPFEQAKQLFFTKSEDSDAQKYYAQLVPESAHAVLEATRWTVEVDTEAIKAPALVLAAEFDQLIPDAPLQEYAKMLRATYHKCSGIGHSDILLKDPEWKEAAQYTLDWLTK